MATQGKSLTTAEFARATGIQSATLSKLIRQGRLKARKRSGKWAIPHDQLEAPVVRELSQAPGSPATRPGSPSEPRPADRQKPPVGEKSFSIAEFAAMTYLTEKGVAEWLRSGRLSGVRNEAGELQIPASNLERGDISRLVRK